MTHTLLVTKPVVRYIEPQRKLFSLFKKNGSRWERCATSSFYMNTARFVYRDRIFHALKDGVYLDIRPIN